MSEKSDQKLIQRILFLVSLVIILLHGYGAISPDATTWGFHHLGFFPFIAKIVALFLFLFFVTTNGQSFLIKIFQTIANTSIKLSFSSLSFYVLLATCTILFWFGRERVFFLGDGNLIVRTLPNVSKLEEVVIAYRNEPFAGWLVWKLYHLLSYLQLQSAEERAFQVLSILFGLGSLTIVMRVTQVFTVTKFDQLLLGLFIVGSGMSQIFFGYVELYSPALFGIFLYLLLSLLYLQGKTRLLYPSLAFGLLVTFHLGMLSLTPSFVFLLYQEFRKRRVKNLLISSLASAIIFTCLLMVSGYTPSTFWANVTSSEKTHFLALTMTGNFWQPYTLFSLPHVMDFVNLNLLVAPFAVPLIIILVSKQWKERPWINSEWQFLSVATICGLGFVFAINPDLGMSRDWDLLSPFVLPAIVFAVFLWIKQPDSVSTNRPIMAMVIGITLVHTISWIALNADTDRALTRFQTLQDARFESKGARSNAYEELAIYFRNQKDYRQAQEYFEKYLAIDSTNSRLWVSLANLHKLTKDTDGEIRAWEKALQHGAKREDIYVDLGKLYIQQQRLNEGLELTKKALNLYPSSAKLLNNMGVILAQQNKNCSEAQPYFLQATAKDSTLAEAFLNVGLCYQMVNDKNKMRLYWERFLQLAPEAPQAANVQQALASTK